MEKDEKNKTNSGMKVEKNILSLIGRSSLIRLEKVVEGFNGNFFTKFEAFNPGHSNKDRIALYIIEEAEKKVFSSPGIPLSRPLQVILVLV